MTRQTSGTRTRREQRRAARGGVAPPSSPRSSPTAAARKFIPLLVICAGLYAYHNGLRGPFIFDDLPAISNNATIRQIWSLSSIMSPPPGLVGRPIVSLSLAVNYALGGLNVWGYH